MITHRPAIDWLTLTSFDFKKGRELNALLLRHFPNAGTESKPESAGRYSGRGGNGWFGGEGTQKGKNHTLYRFSGDLADSVMFDELRPSGLDCTRIDIQLTLPLPFPFDDGIFAHFVELVEILQAHEKSRGQRARSIHPILRPDGWVTIYVGTREGTQRFYRLYVKEVPDSDTPYFRFEVEFKDKNGLAGRVYRSIGIDPLSIVSILAGEIETLPKHTLLDPFHEAMRLSPAELMRCEKKRTDVSKTMKWLAKYVSPAMLRMIGGHDTRDQAVGLLMDWLGYAARLQDLDHE